MTMLLIILLVALMIPLAAVILDSQVGRALAARLERGDGRDGRDVSAGSRMAQLESEVERLGKEVSRLDDETAFLHQLLETRKTPQLPPSVDDPAS